MSPEWIQKVNENVNKVIVVSQHSKTVFENTKYDVQNPQNGEVHKGWGVQVPIEVVNYPVRTVDPSPLDIDLVTDTNFLVVSQWGPRKNLDNTIKWFAEAFQDDETVGLVVKTNTVADSIMDREFTAKRLENLLKSLDIENRKCKIYLLHGEISSAQLTWLYQHPSMQGLINIGHGEGFGLPLFEAAYNGLPLITVTWSGQMDFICKPNKKGKRIPRVVKVDYDIKPIQKEAQAPAMLIEGSQWAWAKESSYKRALKETIGKQAHYKMEALSLKKHIIKNFQADDIYEQFIECLYPKASRVEIEKEIDGLLADLL